MTEFAGTLRERVLIENNLEYREFDGIPIKDHIADVKSEIAR